VRTVNEIVPSVSVIICTNLIDTYFYRALKSIQDQSYKNLEIIIVFNGNNDESFSAFQNTVTDPRISVIKANISGVTFSRNLGLHLSRAPLIAVMDADDIAYPERISEQVKFLDTNTEVDLCGTSYYLIDQNDTKIQLVNLPTANQEIRNSLYFQNPICHPSVIYRRNVIASMGGYASKYGEDYDLWLRLLEDEKIVFANLSKPLLGYRIPVVSQARRSRRVYIEVAGAQFRRFFLTLNPIWAIGGILSNLKALIRAKKN